MKFNKRELVTPMEFKPRYGEPEFNSYMEDFVGIEGRIIGIKAAPCGTIYEVEHESFDEDEEDEEEAYRIDEFWWPERALDYPDGRLQAWGEFLEKEVNGG